MIPRRLAVSFTLLLACGDSGPDPTTVGASATVTATDSSGTAVTGGPECTGSGTAMCPMGQYCKDGVCTAFECNTDDSVCGDDGYCSFPDCRPKRPNGEPCETGPRECQSGLCGQVDDVSTCVAPCEWEDTYPWPPHQCSEGYLCVGPGNVLGADNGHYCWPQGASEHLPHGAACGRDPGNDWGKSDEACETGYCGVDGTCAWRCGTTDMTCPPGMTCADAFNEGAPCTSNPCECA